MTCSKRIAAKLETLPDQPGCYLMRDRQGRIIYVGKAASLRKRVRSYFRESTLRRASPKLRSLVHSVHDIDLLVVRNETEAILTEGRLIKEYRPAYNISFRDDKQFLRLRADPRDLFPKFEICRFQREDGARYFGPYVSSLAVRTALDFAEKRFGIRKCAPRTPNAETYRHCINDIVRHCMAPCIGKTDPAAYQERFEEACAFLAGRRPACMQDIHAQMQQAARAQDFEQAAALRDTLDSLRELFRERARKAVRPPPPPGRPQAGMREIGKQLGLAAPPRVIEGYDVSNISGAHAVASMVCVVDGRPRRNRYRRFRIKTVQGSNDQAMMGEVIARRFRNVLDGEDAAPDLVLVDGGAVQLQAAQQALQALGLDQVAVAGLAKRFEEIHRPGQPQPLRLPPESPALQILQALRDEAHRFALHYHRTLRNRKIKESVLDEVPGVGPRKKEAILQRFGSVHRLRLAPESELAAVPGVGPALARAIRSRLDPETQIL